MIKHTKGPWNICGEHGSQHLLIVADEGIGIASIRCWVPYDEEKANAKLIAAAPTMYEGLQAIFELANDNKSNPHELLAKISQIAEAGIKEVEGK